MRVVISADARNTAQCHLLYKAAGYLCLSVCTPFFRHDRRTATKFGTHVRIDPGIIRAQTHLTHPTPGGSQGGGGLGGQQFKSPGNVMSCPESSFTPPPLTRGGRGDVLGVTNSKVREMS